MGIRNGDRIAPAAFSGRGKTSGESWPVIVHPLTPAQVAFIAPWQRDLRPRDPGPRCPAEDRIAVRTSPASNQTCLGAIPRTVVLTSKVTITES